MYIRSTFTFPQFSAAALASIGVTLDPKGFSATESELASVGLGYRPGSPERAGALVVIDHAAFDAAVEKQHARIGRWDRNGVWSSIAA